MSATANTFALYAETTGHVDFAVHVVEKTDDAEPYISCGETRAGGRALEVVFGTQSPVAFDAAAALTEMLSILAQVPQDAPDLEQSMIGPYATVADALREARSTIGG